MLRKTLFWTHLITGLIAGLFIALLCLTGMSMAFEKDILAWAESEVRTVMVPEGGHRLELKEIQAIFREDYPDLRISAITVAASPNAAIELQVGRDQTFYANPFTGEVVEAPARRLRSFLHTMLELHRWLALSDSGRDIGKGITGVVSLIFMALCLSGLILWWPRSLTWRGFKAVLAVNLRAKGKARDWNWHNSLGFWAMPVLLVITVSAIPISYRWGGNLVLRLAGEQPAQTNSAGGGGGAPQGPSIPAPAQGTRRLDAEVLFKNAALAAPGFEQLTLRLESGRGRSGGKRPDQSEGKQTRPSRDSAPNGTAPTLLANGERKASTERQGPQAPQAQAISIRMPESWPRTASDTLWLNPYTGETVKLERFEDQSTGRRWRSWLRYLHTGEALGFTGKLAAFLACSVGCVLVYTGAALSWRRFFRPRSKA